MYKLYSLDLWEYNEPLEPLLMVKWSWWYACTDEDAEFCKILICMEDEICARTSIRSFH